MPLTPGTRLGRYEVIRLLGAGGMGEVYLAKDERLEREVALKVLPTGTLADESARKRFRREALALSKLTHPNIAVVYDFDTHEGVDFLAMEYVAGQTLVEKLGDGALPEKEVATLGGQIASALEEAHDQGVVHRDLKPGNILVAPKGQTKLLDFGLARLLEPVAEGTQVQTISQSGATAGTMPYMAPEQLRAEKVDARTDIFALGAVLYEMATGQRTFKGDSSPQVTEAILHQAPVTPRALNAQVSPDLERIVLKCLEKDPALRYQSATEVGVDLRRLTPSGVSGPVAIPVTRPKRLVWSFVAALVVIIVGTMAYRLWWPPKPEPSPSPGKIMLAVLPLDNLSGDPDQEYFSDGMTEEMIAQLGRMAPQQLGVIARTSVMRYKNTERSIAEIARDLQVDYILEGSARRVGDTIRVTAQLIQADDQTHLWADSYDREARDVLALQSDVAQAIAREIRITLAPGEEARLKETVRVNPEAHQAYLRGRYFWNKRNEEGFQRSLEYFERSVRLDPTNALAHAGMADTYSMLAEYGYLNPEEGHPKAKAAALKALEIDETLAEAHISLAWTLHRYEWDWFGAEKSYKRGIELNPNYATAHHWYSVHLSNLGRHDEALAEILSARELDPFSLIINRNVGRTFLYARKYDEAIHVLENTIEMDPHFKPTRGLLAQAYAFKGMFEEAIAVLEAGIASGALLPEDEAHLAYVYGLMGRRAEAMKSLGALKAHSETMYVHPSSMASVHTALGENDEAFEWLEKAYQDHDAWLGELLVDPMFDLLREDPRFEDLVHRVGLPPDSLLEARE